MDAALTELIKTTILETIAPLAEKIDAVVDRLEHLEGRFDQVDSNVKQLNISFNRMAARMENSYLTRDEKLVLVPNEAGDFPSADYPETLSQLLVAGNEKLPNGQKNGWNRDKSKKLLRFYGEASQSGSDNDDSELSQRSRDRRLRLARKLGITPAQLNFGILSL
eukprot:TRINITY_DN4829_c0_g1::TRINITY_DN4829_c0_g1_i1::g.998::m.998 TRINITY_DN4829_c0_g1::TRINITY_DN4829_c0_g1_i1::g.998  ORF type:complete len:179 (-),score=11.25,Matrilin_ccoil/PF10393.4/0.2,Matrilin_ccoil/PF10393.4/1.7e+02,RmuC/PF02646.11/0.1 TRINITY_DN4829_c0_g1_i1:108-602(-)